MHNDVVCTPCSLHDESAHAQCPLGSGQAQAQVPLLLLDLIDLEAGQPGSLDAEEGQAPLMLLPDPAAPEQVFVGSATAAWSVCLTWLPALSSWLSEGDPPGGRATWNVAALYHQAAAGKHPVQARRTLLCMLCSHQHPS